MLLHVLQKELNVIVVDLQPARDKADDLDTGYDQDDLDGDEDPDRQVHDARMDSDHQPADVTGMES